jgi:hypothetical protein
MRNFFVITSLLLFAGISFGQTLEKGGTLMVHEWNTTVDDATLDKMLVYWEKTIIPEANKYFPEATFLVLKGEGGAAYAVLMPMLEEMKAKFGEVSFTFRDWMISR